MVDRQRGIRFNLRNAILAMLVMAILELCMVAGAAEGAAPHVSAPDPIAARQVSLPRTPTVAMLPFSSDAGTYQSLMQAASFSAALQVSLLDRPAYHWVEREQVTITERELMLSRLMNESERLQLGRWLNAHLLVRGRFLEVDREAPALELEVIDLSRADLLVRRRLVLPKAEEPDEQAVAAALPLAQAVVIEMLDEAAAFLRAHEQARKLGVLHFVDMTNDARVQLLLPGFERALAKRTEAEMGTRRLLRFPSGDAARAEGNLSLLGLTQDDALAWQYVADAYVWGELYRVRDVPMPKAFEAMPLGLRVEVWNGRGAIEVIEIQTTVAELDGTMELVAEKVWAAAEHPPGSTVSLEARDEVAGHLVRRAARLNLQYVTAPKQNADEAHDPPRPTGAGKVGLEAAAFLAPDSLSVREALLNTPRFTGNETPLFRAMLTAHSVIAAHEEFFRTFGMAPPNRRGREGRWVSSYVHSLVALLNLIDPSQTDDPDILHDIPLHVLEQWRADTLRKLIDVAPALRALIEEEAITPRPRLGLSPGDLLRLSIDAEPLVELVEGWWWLWLRTYSFKFEDDWHIALPYKRPGAGESPILLTKIYNAYAQVGRPERAEELFWLQETDSQEADEAMAPAADRPQRPMPEQVRVNIAARMAQLGSPPPAPPKTEHELAMPVPGRYRDAPSPERMITHRELLDSIPQLWVVRWKHGRHENLSSIRRIMFDGGRLWTHTHSEDSPAWARLHEPASGQTIPIRKTSEQPSIADVIFALHGDLWLVLGRTRMARVDGDTLETSFYGPEQGLASTRLLDIAQHDDQLFVLDGEHRLNRYDAEKDRFTHTSLRLRPSTSRLHNAGDWFVGEGVSPHAVHARTGETHDMMPVLKQLLGEALHGNAIYVRATQPNIVWLNWQDQLIRYDLADRTATATLLPAGPLRDVVVDGDFLWMLAPTQSLHGRGNPSLILAYHHPTGQWVGQFHVRSDVKTLGVSPGRLWVGENFLATLPIYRAVVPGYQPIPAAVTLDDQTSATGATLLMRAAFAGRNDMVRELLDAGHEVNGAIAMKQPFPQRWTALRSAIEGDHAETVALLLARGAQLDEPHNAVAVHAASHGNVETLRLLQMAGLSLAPTTDPAIEPIDVAIQHGHVEAVHFLLPFQAQSLTSLLDKAINAQQPDVAIMLLDRVDRLPATHWNMLPRVIGSMAHAEVVQHLIAAGAAVDGPVGPRPYAMPGVDVPRRALTMAAVHGNATILQQLMQAGADPNQDNGAALLVAVEGGHREAVRTLLAGGADPHLPVVSSGWWDGLRLGTPFALAAMHGNHLIMQDMIEAGLDLHRQMEGGTVGEMAMVHAASRDHLPVVAWLVQLGVAIDAKAVFRRHARSEIGNLSDNRERGRSLLMVAVANDDLQRVRELIELGADPLDESPSGMPIVQLAQGDAVREYLESVAEQPKTTRVFTPTRPGRPLPWLAQHLLVKAATVGDAALLEEAVYYGGNVAVRDREGWPAIVIAAMHGHASIVQRLIELGAHPEVQGPGDTTALMQAAVHGHENIVRVLLDAGADPSRKNAAGRTADELTALHTQGETTAPLKASNSGSPNMLPSDQRQALPGEVDLRESLVSSLQFERSPHDALELIRQMQEPLSVAPEQAERAMELAIHHGFADVVQAMLDAGYPTQTTHLAKLLPRAIRRGHRPVAEHLLRAADDPRAVLLGGPSLHAAAGAGQIDLLRWLLDGYRLPVDHRSSNSDDTALMRAVARGHTEAVVLLLEAGASLAVEDEEGQTPLALARTSLDLELVKTLEDAGGRIGSKPPTNPLVQYMSSLSEEQIEQAVAMGFDPDERDRNGQTPLDLTLDGANNSALAAARIRKLITLGADVKQSSGLLNALARLSGPEVTALVPLLVEKGADVNDHKMFISGATPLMQAAEHSDLAMIEALLKAGADIELRDNQGRSALERARQRDHKQIIQRLEQAAKVKAEAPM